VARDLVYWDSVAFLGMLNGEADKIQICDDVWDAGRNGKLLIVTSTLSSAEVIYVKGAKKLDPAKRSMVSNFFKAYHLSQRPLTRSIAELARDVVWDCNIQPKDAIHIATAAFYKVRDFHTFDGGLLGKKSVDVNGFTVDIRKPYAPGQEEMEV
jgi:hypothetical protein